MVRTRANRKRGSDVESDMMEAAPSAVAAPLADCIDLTSSDDEMSQPKAKRQRRSLRSTAETNGTTAGRAFQRLDHNTVREPRPRRAATQKKGATVSVPSLKKPRVVSEHPPTKPAHVTRTAATTRSKSAANTNNAITLSFRKKKGVPIKTPATEPHESGNSATSSRNSSTMDEDSTDGAAHKPKSRSSSRTRRNSTKNKKAVDDIDAKDHKDPQCCTDYILDIYEHYRTQEARFTIRSPIDPVIQPNITERMRTILVDWILEVHYKFKLNPQTLYLSVSILDRYLVESPEPVSRRNLQLVGITSLLIAAKYEEMFVPELRDLAYICDGAYTESQILDTEECILKAIDYTLTVPTAHFFLVRFLKAAHANKSVVDVACMVMDSSLLTFDGLTSEYLPSQIAAASVLVSRRTAGWPDWSPTLQQYTKYCVKDILPIAQEMMRSKDAINTDLIALKKKYSKTKYGKVVDVELANMED